MKVAIIDLGTNTCNLLIAEINLSGNYKILFQAKEGVNLGKGGINRHLLTRGAFERAVRALNNHKTHIQKFNITQVLCFATSAVRDAENKKEFQEFLRSKTGIEIQIISGNEEATYIFKGVQLAFNPIPEQSLILDIGGGSNEFILTKNNKIKWRHSFPLGMTRAIETVQPSDPITKDEILALEEFFKSGLDLLWNEISLNPVIRLIGCAGAFDTICDLIDQVPPQTKARRHQQISINDFKRIANQIIYSTRQERSQLTGMDPLRTELIVPALLFIQLIISHTTIKEIFQTDYSLREGVLHKLLKRQTINH